MTFAPMTGGNQYWSSTEIDGTYVNIYWVTNNWGSAAESDKTSGWVRPVFAY